MSIGDKIKAVSRAPRRHHYVSEFISKNFVDENDQLHAFNKKRCPREIYVTSPRDAFVKKDLNAHIHSDGSLDFTLEQSFSEFENEVAPVVLKIIENARRSQKPDLDGREKNIWNNFVYYQQKRAPDAFDKVVPTSLFNTDFDAYLDNFEARVRPLTTEERRNMLEPAVLTRIERNAKNAARASGSEQIISALWDRGLVVGVPASSKKSFIIADHPVIRMGPPGRDHLSDPELELWFPIAHDVAVSPFGVSRSEHFLILETDLVRHLNRSIFRQSNTIAARSPALVRSLVGL